MQYGISCNTAHLLVLIVKYTLINGISHKKVISFRQDFAFTVFSRLNAGGVYLKLGLHRRLFEPGFIRGPAFIYKMHFSVLEVY